VDATLDALAVPPPPPAPAASDDAVVAASPDVLVAGRAVNRRDRCCGSRTPAAPDPSLNAGYKRTAGYDTGLFTVTMPVPIFNHNRAARIVAQGQVTAAELELAATERRARADLAATRAAAARLSERARDIRARLVDPARGARDAARAAFATGALDVLRLVDAERVFTDAALVAIDLETDAVVPPSRRDRPLERTCCHEALIQCPGRATVVGARWRPLAARTRRGSDARRDTGGTHRAGVGRRCESRGIETAPARMVERTEPLQASGVVTFDERRTALGCWSKASWTSFGAARRPGRTRRGRGHAAQPRHSRCVGGLLQAQAERRRADTELARAAESRAAQLVADSAVAAGARTIARRRERRHPGRGGGPGRNHQGRAGARALRHQGPSRRQPARRR
jgi:hypothetical protein